MFEYFIALKAFHTVASTCVQNQVEHVIGLRILTLFCSFACVLCFNFLPARASEQGNVIGSVRIYIYMIKKNIEKK